MKKYICCYCGKEFEGWGNNPDTWNGTAWKENDRCCDNCNMKIVIPGRLLQMRNISSTSKKNEV